MDGILNLLAIAFGVTAIAGWPTEVRRSISRGKRKADKLTGRKTTVGVVLVSHWHFVEEVEWWGSGSHSRVRARCGSIKGGWRTWALMDIKLCVRR